MKNSPTLNYVNKSRIKILNEYYAEFTHLAKVILHNYNENDPLPDPTNPPLASHTPMVFAEGLYNPDLKFHVKRMEPRSVDHAFHLAMREARVLEIDQTPGQSGTKPNEFLTTKT